ncbi:hypothetical protein LT493_33115 [Streptomyces tricolor]|nr:hypothetical protein [Streptomyces tricolor]
MTSRARASSRPAEILEGTTASVPPQGGRKHPPPGVHPDRHDERPVHRGRCLRGPGEDHRGPGRSQGHRLRRHDPLQAGAGGQGRLRGRHAGGPGQVRH